MEESPLVQIKLESKLRAPVKIDESSPLIGQQAPFKPEEFSPLVGES